MSASTFCIVQHPVAYLCKMAPMAKLKCVPFLIILVVNIGTTFTRDRPCSGSQTVVRVPVVVREGLQSGTRIDLLSVFLLKKNYSQL